MMKSQRCTPRFGLLLLASLSAPAFSFQPLITDDTGTQGSGGNQLEFAISEDRAKSAGQTERTRTLPAVYTRGLTDTIDVFAGISHVRIRGGDDASGMGNPTLGAKWRFYENEDSKTSFAIKPEIAFPVSSGRENQGLGTGRTSGSLTLIMSQEVPFGAVHVNLGAGRDRYRDSQDQPDVRTQRASIAPVWDLSEQWKLAVDLGLESARADGQRVNTRFVELGAVYSPSKDVDLAFGVLRSSDNESPKTRTDSVTAGVTWRF